MALFWNKWRICATYFPAPVMRYTVYRKNWFNGKLQWHGDYDSLTMAVKEKQRLNKTLLAKAVAKLGKKLGLC